MKINFDYFPGHNIIRCRKL